MTSPHPEDEVLSALMDGDLDAAQRAPLDAHVSGCATCQQVMRELATLHQLAAQDGRVQPARDLWLDIAPQLPRPSWNWRSLLQPLLLGGALAAALVLVVLNLRPQPAVEHTPRKDVMAELSRARGQYLDAITRLSVDAEAAMARVSDGDRKKLRDSLTLVDAAIGECEKALRSAPQDVETNQMLLALYDEKIRVLEAAVDAVPRGGAL